MVVTKRYKISPQAQNTMVHGDPVLFDLHSGNWVAMTDEALDFLGQLETGNLIGSELNSEQQEVIRALSQLGLLIAEDVFEELPVLTEMERLMPNSAYFHVSFTCNLTCPTCYSFDDRRNHHPDLETEQAKTIFQKLRSGGVSDLIISGGEPFVRRDMVELLRYCKKDLGFSNIVVITNGTLLKEELIRELDGLVDQVAVSIDGYNEETNAPIRGNGNFDKAVKSIKLLKEYNIPSHVITTIHKGNVKEANRFLEFGEEMGIHVNFSLFTPSGKGNENNDTLELNEEDLVKLGLLLADNPGKASIAETPCAEGLRVRDRCGIGTHLISVNADGTVYPCHITMLPELAMGNLVHQELLEIMTTSPIAEKCRSMSVETVGHCNGCEYKFFCGGGCRANALYGEGDIMEHDPHCSMNKSFLETAVTAVIGPVPVR